MYERMNLFNLDSKKNSLLYILLYIESYLLKAITYTFTLFLIKLILVCIIMICFIN